MRPSCKDCVRKHLAQALVLACEVKKGYPDHYWLVIGHMAEAEDEILEYDEVYANKIRDERVQYMLDRSYQIPFMDLIKCLDNTDNTDNTDDNIVLKEPQLKPGRLLSEDSPVPINTNELETDVTLNINNDNEDNDVPYTKLT